MEYLVNVKDVIRTHNAVFTGFGSRVADVILDHLHNGDTVKVDFIGTEKVNINFTQFMVHPVYKEFSEKFFTHVTFVNLPSEFAKMELDEAIYLETHEEDAERIDRIRLEAFNTSHEEYGII